MSKKGKCCVCSKTNTIKIICSLCLGSFCNACGDIGWGVCNNHSKEIKLEENNKAEDGTYETM